MLSIIDRMRKGELPNPYELTAADEGKRIDWWAFGTVKAFDIGRRLYLNGKILSMENHSQMEKRKRRK